MKVYIVQELNEYKIYKVSDELIKAFEAEKKDNIVVEGKSIQEVIIGFDAVTKLEGFQFNSELARYKAVQRENAKNTKSATGKSCNSRSHKTYFSGL